MAGQVAQSNAESSAVEGRNRAKLRNFEDENRLYDREVMFDRAEYRNDIQLADIEQDQIHRSMVDQWTQQDQKLNQLFAENDHEMEKGFD